MRAPVSIFSAALLSAISSGCGRTSVAEPIYFGHIAALSGAAKAAGEEARKGIDLALDEVNNSERQGDERPISVLHVDSHDDANNLQPEAVRLISVNHVVALLGSMEITNAERLGKAAQPYDVPVVSFAELPATPPLDNLFSANATLAFYGSTLAQFVSHELKAKNSAVLVDERQANALALAEVITKEFSASGEFHAEEWHFKTEQELAGLAERLNQEEIKAVVLAGSEPDLTGLRSKLKPMKSELPVVYAGSGTGLDLPASDLRALSGVYTVTPFVASGAEQAPFVKKYTEKFHQKPGALAALAYDGIHLLASALRKSASSKAERLKASLQEPGLEFTDLFGKLRMDKAHGVKRPLFIGKIQGGETRQIKRYDPEAK
jgi:branched-chain amino acid transport system substrate-binding protein